MHLILLLITLAIAWGIRCTEFTARGSWADSWTNRWQQTLALFLLPPALLHNDSAFRLKALLYNVWSIRAFN
jgi:hypothetical protein